MTPGLNSPVKLILLILVTVAGFPAFGVSDNPNCTINKIFYTPPSAPMSQNVNWLTQLCMGCQIDTLLCISSARVWCLSKVDKCTDENLGCKDLLGPTNCPTAAPLVNTLEGGTITAAATCPTYMQARGDGKCYCNQHDNDGASLADNNFMTEAACSARYKPTPPTTTGGPPTTVPPTTTPPTPTPPDPKICGDAKTGAETCCKNPTTCVNMPTAQAQSQSPSQGESHQVFCKRMQAAGFNSGSNNSNASETCQLRINECNNKCGTSNDACNGLLSYVQALAQQSLNSFANSDWGRYCAQLTAAQPTPQSTAPGGGPPGGGPPGGGGPTGGVGPTPAEQAMQKQIDAINNAPQGTSAFKDTTPEKGANGFNVGDNQVSPNTQMNAAKYASAEGGSSIDKIKGGGQQGTVANNTGGQIPGGGGAGGGAKLGGGRGTGSPGAPGYTTDVLQGFQGGGGGGGTGGGSTDTNGEAGGGFSGYGGQREPANEGRGLDLRKYLPGGKLDPGSKMGGYKPFSLEINGRGANLWNKISDRFQEKCRLGELIDCR